MEAVQMSYADMALEVYGEENAEYKAFVDKFKPKHTTDDCFTPPNIYEVVAEWVSREYGVSKDDFVRPFYPGGDYESFHYPEDCVVVDNPPFSIIAEIERFYLKRGIRFFLFAPGLSLFKPDDGLKYVCTGVEIEYDNGAKVGTSFVTNMGEALVRSAPDLYKAIKAENRKNQTARAVQLPKYTYPNEVLTAAMVNRYSKFGIDFRMNNGAFIRKLDAQVEEGKAVYGAGFLLSERAAAERAAAELRERWRWQLSDREREICRALSMREGG